MGKYFCFWKNRFYTGLQYRAAAWAGVGSQALWGFMRCAVFVTLLQQEDVSAEMTLSATVTYIWINQAFFSAFSTWNMDNDIFGMMMDGGVAYELCRPVSIYNMWMARTLGGRFANAAMRSVPILVFAAVLPEPYRLMPPCSAGSFVIAAATMVLGIGVTAAFCMFVYILSFFTVSPWGWRMILTGAVELLSGSIIPFPFIPDPYRTVMEYLPFASMQNVYLQIYTGNLEGSAMLQAIVLQLFWLVVLVALGRLLCAQAQHRVVVQGG